MQSLTFTTMTLGVAENQFDNLYTLEQLISAADGWKVVYMINEKYLIEDILAYALIKNGFYYEFIPITHGEVHLVQSLSEYVLKDGYVGMITPKNELVVNEHTVEDVKNLDVQAIKEALTKNKVPLN